MSKPNKCNNHPGYTGESYAPGESCTDCQRLYDYHRSKHYRLCSHIRKAKPRIYTQKQLEDITTERIRVEIEKIEERYNTLVKKHGEEVRRLADTVLARNDLIRHQAKFISRSVKSR